jgi:hypothetical protein
MLRELPLVCTNTGTALIKNNGSGGEQAGESSKRAKKKEKKGRNTGPKMTNETRRFRKNHNPKVIPYAFDYLCRWQNFQ